MTPSARVPPSPSAAGALGEHFRIIAEQSGQVTWIIALPQRRLDYMSAAVTALLGYRPSDFAAQLRARLDDSGPLAALCAGLDQRLQRFAAGDPSRGHLLRIHELRLRDGQLVPVEVRSTLMLDAHGVPCALVGALRDLRTERAAEAGQRRFTSMLNHEFRTPLSTIDGAIQRLEVTGAGADAPTRQRYRNIQLAVDRLTEMLDDYLSPERMEAIGRERPGTSAAPQLLLGEALAQARAAGRAATLVLEALPEAVRCQPEGLQLALKVLVDNALLYTAPEAPIVLSGRRADGGIELVVRDAGPGIAPGELERIFDKGYRGSNAGALAGSGLGLYLARSVVEAHGGSLSASNMAQGGAAFRIWLPAHGGGGKKVASSELSTDNLSN